MAKKVTLNDIAALLTEQSGVLAKQGKEISDLTATVAHVVANMATKDDIAALKNELKSDIFRVQEQVNSIENELKLGKYEARIGKLEDAVFPARSRS